MASQENWKRKRGDSHEGSWKISKVECLKLGDIIIRAFLELTWVCGLLESRALVASAALELNLKGPYWLTCLEWDLRALEAGCLLVDLVGWTQLSPHKVLWICADASGSRVSWERDVVCPWLSMLRGRSKSQSADHSLKGQIFSRNGIILIQHCNTTIFFF